MPPLLGGCGRHVIENIENVTDDADLEVVYDSQRYLL
jgi:hypothetical protein